MIEAELAARAASAIDIEATMRGLRRLGDVYDELEGTLERRALLATCLNRVVVRPGELELQVPAYPVFLVGDEPSREISSQVHRAAGDGIPNGTVSGRMEEVFPCGVSGANSEDYGICRRRGARSASAAIVGHCLSRFIGFSPQVISFSASGCGRMTSGPGCST